jgi:hypothetical protein
MLDAAASIAGCMLLPLASCFFPRISFSAFFQERSNIKIIVLPMDHLYASGNQEIALCFEKSYVASPLRPWISTNVTCMLPSTNLIALESRK